ncbi:MAG: cob(I)yrinic acid a,c-diamide adenosyltransferase [Flavobacterium sp.]|nr:cob(I)yrinic acid a,c-diamide adenosyltransferase [Flavobacterium sp.]
MKIYTKTGDDGTTALFGGTRVAKHNIRIESYGTVDELNSYIGLLRDHNIAPEHKNFLTHIQHLLFTLGAILATPPEKEVLKNGKPRLNIPLVTDSDIEALEMQMDTMENKLKPMTHFVLPGGHITVSTCHVARCICRRAERLTVRLNEIEPVDPRVIKYLNRLSDYLFVLARMLTTELGAEEIKWIPQKL